MEFSDLQEKFGQVFRQYYLPIILGVIGFGFLLYGLIQSVIPNQDKGEILFEAASTSSSESSSAGVGAEVAKADSGSKSNQITVDIEGAVIKPGVYTLKEDARIQDALIAAGGMSDKADRGKIAKGLNLASKISDGGKIYIPFVGESVEIAQSGSTQAIMGVATNGLVNINSASISELDSLPGVGPATAEKIIANRPYEKIEDILSKKSVGNSVFEKIKSKISIF